MPLPDATCLALLEARLHDPFTVLGLHPEGETLWARIWQPGAQSVRLLARDGSVAVELPQRLKEGFFEAVIPGRNTAFPYELDVVFAAQPGTRVRVRDPYSFWVQLPDFDLDLLRAGHHVHLGEMLGAHALTVDECFGVRFAVWAPNAERVSVVGDWNAFNGSAQPMRPRGPSGVWELFLPGIRPGDKYKYEIRAPGGALRVKADPCAWQAEVPPATASIVPSPDSYAWTDSDWMDARLERDHLHKPMSVYEVNLGSWMRGVEPDAWPNYRVLAEKLVAHCARLGFTHIELLPVAQHPFEGSWGYQVTGQYAPNSRHGSPDDFRAFVDHCHQHGLGVIVDFVPGHFPKDDFSLARFDGTPCYEYGDPKEGEHKTWGTCVFNFRRPEVRNFLIGAALHWCRRFHIDGLRIDAVSSMLYRSYDRKDGEWVANEQGGDANWEAVSFLQELTTTVRREFKGVVLIAEESTAWMGVTAPTELSGLGFDLKWNMGWMHDSLGFLALDPVLRKGSQNRITFHQWYAYDEKWVLPLSHDEVVHGKRSLIDKMPGDWWQRRASLRLLLGYQVAVPGRPLLFQGGEFGQGREFDWQSSVAWNESVEPDRQGITAFLAEALRLYRDLPAMHERDDHRDGFQWVDCENAQESILAFLRKAPGSGDVLVACNFTPIPRTGYILGVHNAGVWTELLNSDDLRFGGSGLLNGQVQADWERHGVFPARLRLTLPPLGIVFLKAP